MTPFEKRDRAHALNVPPPHETVRTFSRRATAPPAGASATTVEALEEKYRARLERLYVALGREHGFLGEELARVTHELATCLGKLARLEIEQQTHVTRLKRLRECLRAARRLPPGATLPEDAWLDLKLLEATGRSVVDGDLDAAA